MFVATKTTAGRWLDKKHYINDNEKEQAFPGRGDDNNLYSIFQRLRLMMMMMMMVVVVVMMMVVMMMMVVVVVAAVVMMMMLVNANKDAKTTNRKRKMNSRKMD